MNKKLIPLCLISLFMVACNNNKQKESVITDFTSYEETDKDYETLFSALKLENNVTFTGYRVLYTVTSPSSEIVHNEQRFVYINRENQLYHFIKSGSTLKNGEMTQIDEELYYNNGSRYEKQADKTYHLTDGTVTQQSLTPTSNLSPSKDKFEEIEFERQTNSYSFNAKIKADKANELFATTGLETITDTSFSANVINNELQDVSYKYTLNGFINNIRINIYYDLFEIVLPEAR